MGGDRWRLNRQVQEGAMSDSWVTETHQAGLPPGINFIPSRHAVKREGDTGIAINGCFSR
jgi:hypothetical protein